MDACFFLFFVSHRSSLLHLAGFLSLVYQILQANSALGLTGMYCEIHTLGFSRSSSHLFFSSLRCVCVCLHSVAPARQQNADTVTCTGSTKGQACSNRALPFTQHCFQRILSPHCCSFCRLLQGGRKIDGVLEFYF